LKVSHSFSLQTKSFNEKNGFVEVFPPSNYWAKVVAKEFLSTTNERYGLSITAWKFALTQGYLGKR
jgi:hypothetical protein